MYTQFTTDDWAAATAVLRERMQSEREFDMHLFRSVFGANDELQDSVGDVTFLSTRDTFLKQYTLEMIRAYEAERFPAVNEELGYFSLLHAHDGMLTNIVRPNDHPGLRYEFRTLAPTSGNGKIVYTSCEVVR